MSSGRRRAMRAGVVERWLVGAALALVAVIGQIGGPIAHGFGLDSPLRCEAPASPPDATPAPHAEREAPDEPEHGRHDPSHCAACQAFAAVRVWTSTGADACIAKAALDWSSAPQALPGQARVASLWRATSRGPPACAIVA